MKYISFDISNALKKKFKIKKFYLRFKNDEFFFKIQQLNCDFNRTKGLRSSKKLLVRTHRKINCTLSTNKQLKIQNY